MRIPVQRKPNIIIKPKKGKGSFNRAREKRKWKKEILSFVILLLITISTPSFAHTQGYHTYGFYTSPQQAQQFICSLYRMYGYDSPICYIRVPLSGYYRYGGFKRDHHHHYHNKYYHYRR